MKKLLLILLLPIAFNVGAACDPYYGYDDVMVIYNSNPNQTTSPDIANYFADRRNLELDQICGINVIQGDYIDYDTFFAVVKPGLESCLNATTRTINYLVTTKGFPLKIVHPDIWTRASVDTEISLIGGPHESFIGQSFPFLHPYRNADTRFSFDVYGFRLVTRLTAYTVDEVKRMIDNAAIPNNSGKFIIDADPDRADYAGGLAAQYQSQAADYLATLSNYDVLFDATDTFVTSGSEIMGYHSWGSNDDQGALVHGVTGFDWQRGSIAATYVSTSARSFAEGTPNGPSPRQSLVADLISDGANAVSGNVWEPFFSGTANPAILFAAYTKCYTAADAYWQALQYLSWMSVVVGDPKMRICE